jgi:tetratricopeptide (TPR) repeat protein
MKTITPRPHRILSRAAIAAAMLALGAVPSGDGAATPASPLIGRLCHVPALPAQAEVPKTLQGWAAGAQLFDGLGTVHRAVTTRSPQAQLYFDQGLAWLWAFNHDEATRSFARAAQLDPSCAMCFWGVALTIGPNYNLPLMSAPRGQVAFAALQRAQALAPHASPVEQALIAALARRYPDGRALSEAQYATVQASYAGAMEDVARAYPNDDDVVTLAAEALMGVHAWQLWSLDGKPAPGTLAILAMLERVMARNPHHAGANHYYIHAVEASPDPARAVPAAERLGTLLPGAGHLVHMPAHIFQRVGRYAESASTNAQAARADLAYFARTAPLDYYAGYTAHNWQFEAFSAAAIGRRDEAMAAIAKSRQIVSDELLRQGGASAWVTGMVYTVPVRFGLWQHLADQPPPAAGLPGLTAAWLWARGNALVELHRLPEARAARDALARMTQTAKPGDEAGLNRAPPVFRLALLTLDARLAGAEGDQARRIALLREATGAEDALAYSEPADWLLPVRHLLGRALLENGQPAAAEAVYREDLRREPGNGWALLGLSQALAAEKRESEAAATRRAFARVWASADVVPAYSAY